MNQNLDKSKQQLKQGENHVIGIGAQKSGSTWAWHQLKEHPDIFTPKEKEINFFNRKEPEQLYKDIFGNTPVGKVTTEVSPNYFLKASVPARIHQLVPKTKLFCFLRDPTHRAYSQWKMAQELGNLSKKTSFIEAFRKNKRSIADRGDYALLIERFAEFFPLEQQLKIFFFEDILHRPLWVTQCLFEYIGVQNDFVPETLNTNPNPTSNPKLIPLDEELEVRSYYKESIEKLEQLAGKELITWKTGQVSA